MNKKYLYSAESAPDFNFAGGILFISVAFLPQDLVDFQLLSASMCL